MARPSVLTAEAYKHCPDPVMLVLGFVPGLKDSLRTGHKSLVLALALRFSPWNSP